MCETNEKDERPVAAIKEKCVKCIKGPNLIKTIIVLACVIVVVYQISVCVKKLIHVPVTTYTHFDFNKTIMYPSITFCREPAYKFNKLLEYGLYAHPRHTSMWASFNYSGVNLEHMWDEITYNETDFFVQYGLDGLMENVEVVPTMGFITGRCYTLSPRIISTHANKATGYSVTLQHTADDVATSTSIYPPGYHVYIHYTREPFTEVEVYNGGQVDYLYINTGEQIDAKLTVDEYLMISDDDAPCSVRTNYSANRCTTEYVWDLVVEQVGCSGPWMKSTVSMCNNYPDMRNLISSYVKCYQEHNCQSCPRFCRSYLYNAYVMDRHNVYSWDSRNNQWVLRTGQAALQTQLYIHFNSMMVSVYEECYNYDWNLFVSDLGGSVGFLLGLSVIGLMAICAKVWSTLITPFIKKAQVTSSSSDSSSTTINVEKLKDPDFVKKCEEWNMKNSNSA